MPPRKAGKKAAAGAAVEVEYPESAPEPIVNSTNTTNLVLKLKKLSEALANEADNSDESVKNLNRFKSLAYHLVDQSFMNNTSPAVRVYLALSVAHLFRIFKPNRPFEETGGKLKEALLFMVRALKGLKLKNDEAILARYNELFEVVRTVAVFDAVGDLGDEGAEVVKMLVKSIAEIVEKKSKDRVKESEEEVEKEKILTRDLTKFLRDVLEIHMSSFSLEVLDELFFHITAPQKVNNPEACHLIRNVIELQAAALNNVVQSALVQGLQRPDGVLGEDFPHVGAKKAIAMELLVELYDILPDIMQEALILLLPRLKQEDEDMRLEATKRVCTLMQVKHCRLYDVCPDVWDAFLNRRYDPSPAVRRELADKVRSVVIAYPDVRNQVWGVLSKLVVDGEASVREKAVETICQCARNQLESVSEALLVLCCDRIRDKRTEIRRGAMMCLLSLYKDTIMKENCTDSDREVIRVIARRIVVIGRTSQQDASITMEDKIIVEKGLINALLPMEMAPEKRMANLLDFGIKFTTPELKSLVELLQRNVVGRRCLAELLNLVSDTELEEEEKRKRLDANHRRFAPFFAPPEKNAVITLRAMTNMLSKDPEAFKIAQIIVQQGTSIAAASAAVKNFLIRMKDGPEKTFNKDMQDAVRSLLSRIAPLLIDAETMQILTSLVRTRVEDAKMGVESAKKHLNRTISMLKLIADVYPVLLNDNDIVQTLVEFTENESPVVSKNAILILRSLVHKESAKLSQCRWTESVKEALLVVVNEGYPQCAKHAIHVLSLLAPRNTVFEELKESYERAKDALDSSGPECARALYVLSRMVRQFPELSNELRELYRLKIPKQIIMKVEEGPVMDERERVKIEEAVERVDAMDQIDCSQSTANRLAAIKFAVRLHLHLDSRKENLELLKKTITFLVTIVEEKGYINDGVSPADEAWLRATAAAAVVKLCTNKNYVLEMQIRHYLALGKIAQDSCEAVRVHFTSRVFKHFAPPNYHADMGVIPAPFLGLLAYSLLRLPKGDTEERLPRLRAALCHHIMTCVQKRSVLLRQYPVQNEDHNNRWEYSLSYLLLLLAFDHQEDKDEEEELQLATECIHSLLEIFHNAGPVADWEFIYCVITRTRRAQPNVEGVTLPPTQDRIEIAKKLWSLCDITKHLIVHKLKQEVNTGEQRKTMLSSRFFQALKQSNEDLNTVYAPEEFLRWIETGKKSDKMKATFTERSSSRRGRGRGGNASRGGRGGRRRKGSNQTSEADEEEEADDVKPSPKQTTSRRGSRGGSRGRGGGRRGPAHSSPAPSPTRADTPDLEPIDVDEKPGPSTAITPAKKINGVKNPRLAALNGRDFESDLADLSPIMELAPQKRVQRGFASSTPLPTSVLAMAQPRRPREEIQEEEEEEEVEESPPAKKGKGKAATKSRTASPVKAQKNSSVKSNGKADASKSPAKGRTARNKRQIEEDEDEEEEEEEKETKQQKPLVRTSSRSSRSKKVEKEEEEEEEEDEKETAESEPAAKRVRRLTEKAAAAAANASPTKQPAPKKAPSRRRK